MICMLCVLWPGICRKLVEHFGRIQSSTGFLPLTANQLLASFNHLWWCYERKKKQQHDMWSLLLPRNSSFMWLKHKLCSWGIHSCDCNTSKTSWIHELAQMYQPKLFLNSWISSGSQSSMVGLAANHRSKFTYSLPGGTTTVTDTQSSKLAL
jgi:hypothetical protein